MTSFTEDNRGAAMQIGFILIFGMLVLVVIQYQATIVPQQNQNIEIQHSEDTHHEFSVIENKIFNTGMTGLPSSTSIEMAPRYPTRLIALNPPPPSATISTSEPTEITVSNDTDSYDIPTRFMEYKASYREYSNNPTYTYEPAFTYAEFDNDVQTRIEDNLLFVNEGLAIVALQGDFDQTSQTTARLRFAPTDNLVVYEVEDLSVTIPTRLSESHWESVDESRANVDVTYNGDNVEIERSGTSKLYLSGVYIGDNTDGGVNHDQIEFTEIESDSPAPSDPSDPSDPPELTLDSEQRGASGNYDLSWTTDPEIEGGSITLIANNDVVETGLSQSETDYRYQGAEGDEIEIQLIDENGDVVQTATTTLS